MTWPSDEELLAAWARLAGDPTAVGAFVALALAPLAQQLAAWRWTADTHIVESVAVDVVLWLVKYPAKYEPDKSPLRAFLLFVARRKLLTALDREGRHHQGRIPWDDVEHAIADGNEEQDDALSFDHLDLRTVIAGFDDTDRQLFELMRAGERDTDVFAAAMGAADLPPHEQNRMVKRAKDRIKARLKRAVGGSDG
ncbi:MAG: hypothetical protein MUF18_16755 [Fimbriiglobus sp.]|jgi:DNA-directed RNA polymerase specialized sigma24 family protein|nr:hypothetical protein [Fimbriiglobus sp.]